MYRRTFLATAAFALHRLTFSKASAQESQGVVGSSTRYRVGVIGHTGQGNYGHGLDTVWKLVPNTEIVAVADPDDAGRAAAKARLAGVADYADYEDMLREVRPEIVVVCPRHVHEHHAMMRAAIAAGARGIYVEKPFVRTPAEADDIRRLCREKGVKIAVAHRNRYHPALPVTEALLAEGKFGTLLEVRARGKEDHRGGGLDLWVLGSHVLNLGTHFAGKAVACTASFFQENRLASDTDIHEGAEGLGPLLGDEVHARFETEKGIPLFFDSKKNAGDRSNNFGLQLICSGGIVDLRIDTEPLVHWLPGNPFKPNAAPRQWLPITSGGIGVPEPLKNIVDLVARHVAPAQDLILAVNSGSTPLCDAEAASETVEMIHGTFASFKKGGARILLPLENRQHALSAV
jgi:predicted dehydrogenase